MSRAQWALYALAVLAMAAAALGVLPFGWAHDASNALSAAVATGTAFLGYTVTQMIRGK